MRLHAAERTHCKNGHEFTPENTRYWKDKPNRRVCVACTKVYARRVREKKKAARDRAVMEHAQQALA